MTDTTVKKVQGSTSPTGRNEHHQRVLAVRIRWGSSGGGSAARDLRSGEAREYLKEPRPA